MFLEDIDPILPKRPFHAFRKILIACPIFYRDLKVDLHDVSVPVFSNIFKIVDFRYLLKMIEHFSWVI